MINIILIFIIFFILSNIIVMLFNIVLLLGGGVFLHSQKYSDYIQNYIIIFIILLIIINLPRNENEHLTNDEILANIGSLYNNQNMTISNLNITGKLTVGDDAIINGYIRNKKGITTEMIANSGTVEDLPIWAKNINLTPLNGAVNIIDGDAIINGYIRNKKGITTEMIANSGTVEDLPIWAKNINLTPLNGAVNIIGGINVRDDADVRQLVLHDINNKPDPSHGYTYLYDFDGYVYAGNGKYRDGTTAIVPGRARI